MFALLSGLSLSLLSLHSGLDGLNLQPKPNALPKLELSTLQLDLGELRPLSALTNLELPKLQLNGDLSLELSRSLELGLELSLNTELLG